MSPALQGRFFFLFLDFIYHYFKIVFIHLLAALSLLMSTKAKLVAANKGYSLITVHGILIAVAFSFYF